MKDVMNKVTRTAINVGMGLIVTAGFVLVILDASKFNGW